MRPQHIITSLALIIMLALGGCMSTQTSTSTEIDASNESSGIARNEPYFPTKFNDFEIPGELEQDLSQSMIINTSSFSGGILNFTGRVELNSLTDFFINSMQKNGWKIVGEVRYKNIMLAFNKPNKNCMITIYPGDFGKTRGYAYITSDLQGKSEQNL